MKIARECPESVLRPRIQESARHRAAVDRLIALGMTEGNFSQEVQWAIGDRYEDAPLMTPDAYQIHRDRRVVDVYEVEVSHFIDAAKWTKLAVWSAWLRGNGWSLRVARVDVRGAVIEFDPLTREMTAREWARVQAIFNTLDQPLDQCAVRQPARMLPAP